MDTCHIIIPNLYPHFDFFQCIIDIIKVALPLLGKEDVLGVITEICKVVIPDMKGEDICPGIIRLQGGSVSK